jgi:hypothetical protein
VSRAGGWLLGRATVPVSEFMDAAHEALEIIRRRLEHEDNLVNQRLSWILSSQAFLLTGYAILLNAPGELRSEVYVRHHAHHCGAHRDARLAGSGRGATRLRFQPHPGPSDHPLDGLVRAAPHSHRFSGDLAFARLRLNALSDLSHKIR